MHRALPLTFAAALLLATPSARADEEEPAPLDASAVKKGQRYVYETKSEMEQMTSISEMTWTVIDVQPGKQVEVEVEMVTRVEWKIPDMPKQEPIKNPKTRQTIPLVAPRKGEGPQPEPANKPKELKPETLTIDGQTFACKVYEMESAGTKTKAWTSTRFPFTVRTQFENPQVKGVYALTKILPPKEGKDGKEGAEGKDAQGGAGAQSVTAKGFSFKVKPLPSTIPGFTPFEVEAAGHEEQGARRAYGTIKLLDAEGKQVGSCTVFMEVPPKGAKQTFQAKHRDAEGKALEWKTFSVSLNVVGAPKKP